MQNKYQKWKHHCHCHLKSLSWADNWEENFPKWWDFLSSSEAINASELIEAKNVRLFLCMIAS